MKTLLINLDRSKDRLIRMTERLSLIDSLQYERIEAIDGKNINHNQFNKQIFDNPNIYACLLSHIKAIKHAKEQQYKEILIIEDDIVFCDDFDKRLELFLKQAPKDWQMLYLGFNPHVLPTKITENIYKLNKSLGAFAYILKESIFDEVIEVLEQRMNPTDNALANLQAIYNCYAFLPFLVYVEDGYSETSLMNLTFPRIKTLFAKNI